VEQVSRRNQDLAVEEQSAEYARALDYARIIHAAQRRKGTDTPYVSHPIGVAELVLEHGGSETQAIAALLHDAVEDQGGRLRLEDIRERFGQRVAELVEGCTEWIREPDQSEADKPPWRERKERFIAHFRDERDPSVLLVALADKVHNAGTIVADLRAHGPSAMERFSGGRDGTLWYYRELLDAFRGKGEPRLYAELERLVAQMHGLLGEESTAERMAKAERIGFIEGDADEEAISDFVSFLKGQSKD
jgi:(p)ppGpp synthase/HD superfamily hydrolase